MPLPSDIDIAIIGAGAAGLAAARVLEGSGRSLIVLEARERTGGRAHTINFPHGIRFDLGCGWLHSADRNGFVAVARQLGFDLDTTEPRWREQSLNIGFSPDERRDYLAALDAFYDRAEQAALRENDGPASAWLEPGNRWNPLIDAISTYVNGCELDQVSVYDMDAYEDTGHNWRVVRGYGALVQAFGASCPVALGVDATVIDHTGTRLRIETSQGTLTAGQVIVTVPTNILATERLRFYPALTKKTSAAAGLPLGLADKVILQIKGDVADLRADEFLRGAKTRTATGSYQLRPFGSPCIEGFFGGRHARELEDAGEGALAAAAIDEIAALLGNGYRSRLKPLMASRWAHDPFALGSYSHSLPGQSGDRAILAEPVDGRIFFAGEATSPGFFSTAHGAKESGERAAREVLGRHTAD